MFTSPGKLANFSTICYMFDVFMYKKTPNSHQIPKISCQTPTFPGKVGVGLGCCFIIECRGMLSCSGLLSASVYDAFAAQCLHDCAFSYSFWGSPLLGVLWWLLSDCARWALFPFCLPICQNFALVPAFVAFWYADLDHGPREWWVSNKLFSEGRN